MTNDNPPPTPALLVGIRHVLLPMVARRLRVLMLMRLLRSLYGLKQAPRVWFQRFAAYITTVGFTPSRCDSSLFIYRQGDDTAFLLLYVDDIVLTASSDRISVTRDSSGMFLSQRKYAMEILERAYMVGCNSSRTPVDTESKLGDGGTPVVDLTLYQSLAGSLQYLTFTRPDITYAVQQVYLYMHDPREPHFSALKWILRYVQGTLDYGLQLFSSTTDSLIAYSDADWAGCPTTRWSTLGYCIFLGNNLLSWSSKRQPTLSHSSAEAKYRGVANVVAETCWIWNLLRELHTPLSSATIVYCDNVSVVYLSSSLVQHQRTKHIKIDIHFVRDLVATRQPLELSRYDVLEVVNTTYWGFLEVGITIIIFQNIPIIDLRYGVLVFKSSLLLVKSRHRYVISFLMDTTY
ncbi:ribonuclease H-like domain-containing protein [Tanacetum coccineum]